VAACGRGAQLGIFIKGHHALESSGLIDTVVFDKTGTITSGQMTVTEAMAAPGTGQAELLRYAGAVEQASEHPIAAAISEAASVRIGPLPVAEGFRALPGLGAHAVVDGRQVIVGREKLLRDQGTDIPPGLAGRWGSWEQDGRTAVLVGWDGRFRGAFAVADTIKPSAQAAADLGVAVGAGTDVAISAADLILLRPDLTVVPDAIALARAARRTIRRYLGWAFGYNVAAVPLAAAGFLNPLIAAAAMTMSSVLVVANSLRLRRFRVASSRRKQ
jgi:P-type Cu+ transporter